MSSKVDLRIQDPTFLLNHIASNYRKLSKIIAEFVDNSLDDAEQLVVRDNGKIRYSRPVHIKIRLEVPENEFDSGAVDIVDNCHGLSEDELLGLAKNVGRSKKRNDSKTHGFFGYGINSFRACAGWLSVRTKHESGNLRMDIFQEQTFVDAPEVAVEDDLSRIMEDSLGTHMRMLTINKPFLRDLKNPETLCKELGQHFFYLLSNRENLHITLTQIENNIERDFSVGRAAAPIREDHWITKDVEELKIKGFSEPIRMKLGVLPHDTYSYPPLTVISHGREVKKLFELESFERYKKEHRKADSIWNRTQVLGYIDVGNALEQVISRDEFKESEALNAFYSELMKYGKDKKRIEFVEKIIAEANDSREKKFQDFMAVMLQKRKIFDKCFERLDDKDDAEKYEGKDVIDRQIEKEVSTEKKPKDAEGGPKKRTKKEPKAEKKQKFRDTYTGQFPILLEHAGADNLRSWMDNNTTIINKDHPDARTELYGLTSELKHNKNSFRYLARQISGGLMLRRAELFSNQDNLGKYLNEMQNMEMEILRTFTKGYKEGMFDSDEEDEDEDVHTLS